MAASAELAIQVDALLWLPRGRIGILVLKAARATCHITYESG